MSPRTVFLSHTSDLDLWPAGRSWVAAAKDAVSGAGGVVSDMKYFKAKDKPPAAVSEEAVKDADVYVGIIGWNYGAPVLHRPDVSFTEYEFEVATRIGKPRLIFLVPPEQRRWGRTLPPRPLTDRQRAFRDRLKTGSGLTIKEVESPDRLSEELSRALHDLDTGRKWFSTAPSLDGSETPRPAEFDAVVDALCDEERGARTVALWGPGGFGKSTLAQLVADNERVRRRFADGVLWLGLGKDVVGERLAEKLNDATYHLTRERPPLTSPEAAGAELRRALRDRCMLIVVDDVWHDLQVKATAQDATPPLRLLTTRDRSLAPRSAKIVEVGAMDEASATALLTADIAPCSPRLVAETLQATGSCAFLLRLVKGIFPRDGSAPDPILEQFLDAYENEESEIPNHGRFEQFIGTSVKQLEEKDRTRFTELAVLPADVTVDEQVVRVLWAWTGGGYEFLRSELLTLLSDRCLVIRNEARGVVRLHNVIHDYLHARTSRAVQARLNRTMLDAHRAGLPTAAGVTAWWELPENFNYMWSWTVAHLAAAGLQPELDALVCHPAWIAARLKRAGPEAVLSDLKHGSTALARQLADAVRQSAHLLGALSPEGSVVATLASRLPQSPESAAVARGLTAGLAAAHLVMTAPAPDLPHPALGRVLPGSVTIHFLVAVPTAGWLATAAWEGSGERCAVTLWEPTTGKRLRNLDGVCAPLTAMTADPDGRWIAAADRQSIRVWGTDDGRLRHTHEGGAHKLTSLGGGRWLATLDRAELRVLDPVTGEPLQTFRGDGITFDDVVAEPAGTWLAVQSEGDVFIVEPATGTVVSRVAHPIRRKWYSLQTRNRMTAAPDGSWLAAARGDALVLWTRDRNEWDTVSYSYADSLAADPRGRWIALLGELSVAVWDTARRDLRWRKRSNFLNREVLVDPQGRWLATSDGSGMDVLDAVDGKSVLHFDGRTARLTCDPAGRFLAAIQADSSVVPLWEISTGHLLHTLWHAGWVTELTANTHGGWFASADDHGDVRVWNWPYHDFDAPDAPSSAQIEGVGALAADAELRCLATVDNGGSLRLWDADTGTMRHPPRPAYRKALAVAPNGAWVATTHEDRLEIVDVPSGMVRHTIEGVDANENLVAIPRWNAVAAHVPAAIRVWNVDSGRPILDFPHSSWRTDGLLADPLGRWLAVASHDALRIWSLPSGEQLAVIDGFVGSPVIGAGSRWIVGTLERGQIEVWDSTTGEHLRSLTGGDLRASGVAVDPNGCWIASRHDNDVIDLWDVELGSRVHTLGEHPGGVTTFAPSPREGLLASAGEDGVIKVWRPWAEADERLVASLRVSAAVRHLCWVDERLIAAGAYGPYVLRLVDRPEPHLGQE